MTAWRGAPVSTPLLRKGNMKKIGAKRATPRMAAANQAYRSKNNVTDIALTQRQADDFTAEIEQGFPVPARQQEQACGNSQQLETERQGLLLKLRHRLNQTHHQADHRGGNDRPGHHQ